MTEKRYSLVYYADKGGAFIKNNENGTEWYHDSRASLLEIVDNLNELSEENKDNKAMIEFLSTENIQIMDAVKTRTQIQHQLEEENEQLKTQLQNTSDQRDEFYRGARENANNVGQLEKENEELKKQLEREETDKKRLMSLLMKYKSYSFDEIVEDILDEPYYDNWWEDGFYESCWDEYLKEKGFNGCDKND